MGNGQNKNMPVLNDKSPRPAKGGSPQSLGDAQPNSRVCGSKGEATVSSTKNS